MIKTTLHECRCEQRFDTTYHYNSPLKGKATVKRKGP